MSEPSDQPTRDSDLPDDPLQAETRDAPMPPEPGTLSAGTHTSDGEPLTTSLPRASASGESVFEPPGFVIVRELGSGGMGIVYEARQARLNRRVALKVLRGGRGSPQDVFRFLTEAEAVAAISHPHVVQVYEVGQHAGGPFMALELLTGGTLSERLRRDGRLEPSIAAELVAKLASAVHAAHELGIVHRDLKPGNVLFDADGTPKITDFGLAKKGGTDITRTQAVMGTPAYMAPEQARGEAKFVGPPADIWALGAILYECLTGKRAFEADDTWAVLRKVTDEAPPTLRSHVPGLPRDLELIALKCLEKHPPDRYPSAAALAADLENYLAGRPVTVRPAGRLERGTKWVKRNPGVALSIAAVSLALVVGSVVSLTFGIQAARRGDELARANGDLTRANDDLGRANADLTVSRNQQILLAGVLKTARDGLAKQASELIEANETAAERGYLSDIALAHQLWKANDLRGMRVALDRCAAERRRWEWHYLDRLSRPQREVIAADSLPLALAYSPDGKRLAYLTLTGTLTVRELATGRESQFTVDRTSSRHRVLTFHPDSKKLAFATGHRVWVVTLEPWEVKELTEKQQEQRRLDVNALVYTPDGRLLGSSTTMPRAGEEWVITIHDLLAGTLLTTLKSGQKAPNKLGVVIEVGAAAFSADGNRFAASFVDSGIRVGTAAEVNKLEPFRSIAGLWDVPTAKLLAQTDGATKFGDLAFRGKGSSVAVGARGQAVELDGALGKPTRSFAGQVGEVWAVAFDPRTPDQTPNRPAHDDRISRFWLGGEDKLIRGYDLISGTERYTLRGCASGVLRLAVSPDGKEVAAAVGDMAGGNGVIHRFDVAAIDADIWRAPSSPGRISLVTSLSSDGKKFAVSDFPLGGDQAPPQLVIRDLHEETELKLTRSTQWPQVVFRPLGGFVILEGSELGKREEWLRFIGPDQKDEGKDGDRLALPQDAKDALSRSLLVSSPDSRTLVVVSNTRLPANANKRDLVGARITTWNSTTRDPGPSYEVDLSDAIPKNAKNEAILPTGAVFDPAGGQLAATFIVMWEKERQVDYRGAVLVWNMATGTEVLRQFTLDPMRAVTFAPDGTLMTAGGNTTGGVVYGWNLKTQERTFVMQGHTRSVLALAVGPDGRIATGGADRVLKVWDVASRREILTLDGFAHDVTHVAFTPDGKNLIAGTGMSRFDAMLSLAVPTDWLPAEVRTFRGPK